MRITQFKNTATLQLQGVEPGRRTFGHAGGGGFDHQRRTR